jgi:large subunit GTPase 1
MTCCGVLSIDNLREFHSACELVVHRIPRHVLEKMYKVKLPPPEKYMSATHFLQIFANDRGYVTGSSRPDEIRCAKLVLKDYVTGKLVFVHLRPDFEAEKHDSVRQTGNQMIKIGEEIFTESEILEKIEEGKEISDDEGTGEKKAPKK